MTLPAELSALLDPAAYPHPCGNIEVVETHISWVILTGELVYKVKKPVAFSFIDFSTLARRRHFCEEELRCNRAFAPSLYLAVVPVTAGPDGVRMGGDGDVVEWAVKMRQFPQSAQLDRLLESGGLRNDRLEAFGASLAARHRQQPGRRYPPDELDRRVLAPVRDNFRDLEALDWMADHGRLLERARQGTAAATGAARERLAERLSSGAIRECHGDLHLSNLVLLDDAVCAFDCLEFDPDLRWIDPMSDVAFLFMDCLVRDRADLAYGFLDGYLGASGDYRGCETLAFYAAYRSMVRAKVAALRRGQARDEAAASGLERRALDHVRWTADWLGRPPGRLLLMCGLSGSGKSHLARRLAPRLPAVRLRSDVARKVGAGLDPAAGAGDGVGQGLYAAERTEALYEELAAVTAALLRGGEHVIVDATFLDRRRRDRFAAAARLAGSLARVIWCDAPAALLEARIEQRRRQGGDPSDADLAVLAAQRRTFEPPGAEEGVIRVDTSSAWDDDALVDLTRRLLDV